MSSADGGEARRYHPDAATGVRALAEAADRGLWEQVDDLLNEQFYRCLFADRDELQAVFRSLPEEWYEAYPRHRLTKEIAFATGSMQLLSDRVQRRFVAWVRGQDSPAARDRLAIHTLQMRTMLATGNYHGAASKADDVQRLVETADDTAGFDDVLPTSMLRAGQAKLHVGELDAASDAFNRAHRWALSRSSHPAERYIRSHLALIDALHGDFNLARAWFVPLDDVVIGHDGLEHQLRTAELLIRALVSVCSGSAEEGAAALERVAYEHSSSDLWWVGAHARALYDLQWGEPRRGVARVEQALRNFRSSSTPDLIAGQLLRADLASLYQMSNELDAAEQVLSTPDLDSSHVLVRAAHARQNLLRGHPAAAVSSIESSPGGAGQLAPVTTVLLAAIEHAASGGATERTLTRAADHVRASGALFAIQETIEPTRGRILRRLDLAPERSQSQYPYHGVIAVDLSERETQVLAALVRHDSVAAIARELHLSTNTVKTYKRSLYRKLGARNRAEALEYVVKHEPRQP